MACCRTADQNWPRRRSLNVCFSNRPGGVKRFQAIHDNDGNVARGLVLLYGIGTLALPSWDSKTRWNNLLGGLAVGRSKQTCELTSSIVPRGTPFHRMVELRFPPSSDLVGCSCDYWLPGPAELGAIHPDAVHDHRQPAGQRDNSSLDAAALGDLHRPGLEP
jgi:hypothetical protein